MLEVLVVRSHIGYCSDIDEISQSVWTRGRKRSYWNPRATSSLKFTNLSCRICQDAMVCFIDLTPKAVFFL